MCGVITVVKQCALRAPSTHGVHHAIVEVNIVIGVVFGELHVVVRVHVPLVVVCDEAVVRRTLGLIALVVIVVFVVAILNRIVLYGRYILFTESGRARPLETVTKSEARNHLYHLSAYSTSLLPSRVPTNRHKPDACPQKMTIDLQPGLSFSYVQDHVPELGSFEFSVSLEHDIGNLLLEPSENRSEISVWYEFTTRAWL